MNNPTHPKNITEIPLVFFNAIKVLTISNKNICQKADTPLDYCTSSSMPSGAFQEILEEEDIDYLEE